MDLLMKIMDDLTSEKASIAITTQTMDSLMTCEVCGDTQGTTTTMVIVHREVKHGISHTLIIREVSR
jgi:hypothetical protein